MSSAYGVAHATLERRKLKVPSQVRAVVEHPFRIVKNRFHHKKLRYRGLFKNRQAPGPMS